MVQMDNAVRLAQIFAGFVCDVIAAKADANAGETIVPISSCDDENDQNSVIISSKLAITHPYSHCLYCCKSGH